MQTYRLYFIDRADVMARAPELIECPDDDEAVRRAEQLAGDFAIELWESMPLVGSFPAKG